MSARRVEIVEVAPRDGLQSEDTILDADTKVELINRAVGAGVRRIEVCSFVNPARVPQMADAEAVLAALPVRDDVTYIGLVLNRRGFERAAAAGVREINVDAAIESGIDALDASLGGIGGCPFAPNATGNIPTEDLAYLLARMGVATGLDLEALTDIVPWIEAQLGKRVPGLLSKAGLFPAA